MNDSKTVTILIVDDEPRNLRVLSDMLSASGFEVAAVLSGERSLRVAKQGLPDLILLDVKMDGMDGFETCRRLKMDPATADIPIIFMTASSEMSKEKVKGLKLGAVDFILKPFQDEELLARIHVHIELRRATKNLTAQVEERRTAEAALQKLTHELERRVAERTSELEKALDGLTQAHAHMATIFRATQAIAGEVILERVLDRLLRITFEHAVAQKCILVLVRDASLVIDASITNASEAVHLGPSIPVESSADLAVTIVQEVATTKVSVFLWDTSGEARFAGDSYLAKSQPKSILCLAMVYQGELTGVLYIEGDPVSQPFASVQLETLQLLASQAAVSVKVALLYDALRHSNNQLEIEIGHRTEELRRTNERLTLELAERERSDKERAALQAEIIRTQSARLAELSTPLIPLSEEIMVMPLIGTIDAPRAQQALEAALNSVHANRANVVIMDVTGVMEIDAPVAATLISTVAALRLLGAKAIITGLRPELAQKLVLLGIELRGIVTKGTLKSGIVYALGQAGVDTHL